MHGKHIQLALLCILALVLSACVSGISRQARSQVSYVGPFESVQQKPEKYRGEIVMWGGKIIEIQVREGLTEILVLQLKLDGRGRPGEIDQSRGRFMIRSSRFMDPAVYSPGAFITVVGRLQGVESRLIGEMPYRYPVIDVAEIEKWEPEKEPATRFHIGIGVGGRL